MERPKSAVPLSVLPLFFPLFLRDFCGHRAGATTLAPFSSGASWLESCPAKGRGEKGTSRNRPWPRPHYQGDPSRYFLQEKGPAEHPSKEPHGAMTKV